MTGPPSGSDCHDAGGPHSARREVLRTCAAAGGIAIGVGSLGGVAVGQEGTEPGGGITTIAVINEQEEYGQEVLGFWIHLAAELDPYEASVADRCERVPWEDQQASAYDATMIDRQADPVQSRVTVYVHDAVDVNPGDLYIVNEVHPCDGPYVSLRLEQIGAPNIGVGLSNEAATGTAVTDTSDGVGAGMGLPAAFAALLGGGALARWLRDDGDR